MMDTSLNLILDHSIDEKNQIYFNLSAFIKNKDNIHINIKSYCLMILDTNNFFSLLKVYQTLFDNIFILDNDKINIKIFYNKLQNTRRVCFKFIIKMKNKCRERKIKNKIYKNSYCLDLERTHDMVKYPIYIYEGLSVWWIDAIEFYNYILVCITNRDMITPSVTEIKNPYTNIKISYELLLNICKNIMSCLLVSNVKISNIFYYFLLDKCIYKYFINKRQNELTKLCVNNYVNSLTKLELKKIIERFYEDRINTENLNQKYIKISDILSKSEYWWEDMFTMKIVLKVILL